MDLLTLAEGDNHRAGDRNRSAVLDFMVQTTARLAGSVSSSPR